MDILAKIVDERVPVVVTVFVNFQLRQSYFYSVLSNSPAKHIQNVFAIDCTTQLNTVLVIQDFCAI
jgi:hypothetical protein